MALSKPLSFGKHHHCSIYYNYYEGHRSRCDEDQRRSYDFVKHLDDRLCEIGFTKVHYFDKIPPGVNLFEELFSNMLELSEKIVVIFTKDFITNHWHKLVHQSNFKELLDRNESVNFLGISLGLTKSQLPKGLGMCVHSLVYFDTNWKDEEEQWNSITRFFLEDRTTSANLERSVSNVPVQETVENLEADCVNEVGGAADLNDSHRMVVDGVDDSSPGAAAVVSDHDISEMSSDTKSLQEDENKLCQDASDISIQSLLKREEGSFRSFVFRAWNVLGWLKKNVNL